jgi:tetratricopeptide (TPR) repeat protein
LPSIRIFSVSSRFTRLFSSVSREGWLLCFLFIVSFLLRLGYLQEIRNYPLFSSLKLDEQFHDRWAQSISSGNVIGDDVFFRAPFYPYFLGAIYRIAGYNVLVPRIIQHLLGSISVLLFFFLCKKVFGKPVAWIASVLYALYPFVIYIEDQLLLESVVNVELLLLFLLVYRGGQNPGLLRWFFIGILVGILSLIRPTFLPLLVILIGYLFYRYVQEYGSKKVIGIGCGVAAGTILMIAPVTIRNYVVGKDTVLIASQGGINFYMGNNPDANGYLSSMPGASGVRWEYRDFVDPVRKIMGHEPKPSELSDYWYREGLHFLRDHPVDFIKLLLKKYYMFWSAFEIPNNQNFYSFENQSKILRGIPIGFWFIGPLGVLGMVLAWKSRRGRLAVAFVFTYSIIVTMFFICDRFRMPVLPFLCLFSAVSIVSLYELARKKRFGEIGLCFLLLILFGWLTNSNLMSFEKGNRKTELFFLGNAAVESKQYDDAIDSYRECVLVPGNLPDVYLNWGVALWNMGKVEEALQKFRLELQSFSESYNTLTNIAHIYLLQGLNDSAIVYAARALSVKPYASAAYIDMGLAYSNLQKFEKADSILTLGKLRCGDDEYLYGTSVLAGIHLVEGKTAAADTEYRGVLQKLKPNAQPSYLPEFQFSLDYGVADNYQNFKAKIYYSMGHLYLQTNNADSAISYFTLATDESPVFADAWFALGNTLLASNRPENACTAFGKSLEVAPGNPDAWYQYGVALREVGQLPDAKSAFSNALKLDSTFQEAKEALSLLPAK